MDGVIELQRRTHEDMDRLEVAAAEILAQGNQGLTQKERISRELTVSALLNQISSSAQQLLHLYKDDDKTRAQGINEISIEDGTNIFGSFYVHLKELKDDYRRSPFDRPIDDVEFDALVLSCRPSDEMLEALFSGEEAYGKYLDLVHHHHVYLNLKGSKKGGDLESKSEQFDYLRYIEEFDNFDAIPETIHSTSSYAKYVSDLCAYLVSYFKRAKPLFDIQSVQDIELSELLSQSNSDGYSKAKVFCEPCNHFFANEAVYNGHLGGKKHLRAVEKTKDGSELSNSEKKKIEPNFQDTGVSAVGNVKNSNLDRSVKNSVVYNERIISRLASILGETRQETRLNVERKQSRTYEERLNDLIAEETAAPLDASAPEFTSASIGDDRIYNPLNLPLDWDGKPIPYWLWKLHGLGVRFPCEICGNQVYMGRRSFDHHFSEWRHINGMKALGIPNSPHFFQITNVQEALDLWEQLKKNAKTEIFRPEAMEECEDAMGNVYTRKTFEDLRRQGLL